MSEFLSNAPVPTEDEILKLILPIVIEHGDIVLTPENKRRITDMIESSDKDNVFVAEAVINQLLKKEAT